MKTKENLKLRCDALLTALVGKNLVDDWWNRPNKGFDLQTPIAVFEQNPERVYNYLMRFSGGDYM
jgi:hypothetical protein